MGNHLCHFEFMVSDSEKGKAFYGKVFDWEFTTDPNMGGYTMIDAGKEPGGGMMKKPDTARHHGLTIYFCVDSIDDTMAKVTEAGGQVAIPKMEVPGMGWWGLFMDPDGIPVGVFEAGK
jgi:predicted enzyme related to lactoylglutathione lyase